MAKQKWVRPEGCPLWFDGKNVNEAMFCQEFLTKHRLLYTENAFFTVNGRMVDETPLKSAIYIYHITDKAANSNTQYKQYRKFTVRHILNYRVDSKHKSCQSHSIHQSILIFLFYYPHSITFVYKKI